MTNLARTIPQVLQQAAKLWPDKLAIQDGETQLSFGELELKAQAVASAMIGSHFQFGDRFSIWAANIHEWVWVALGGMMAGGVLVPLNTRYKGIEAGDILRRSQSRWLFTTCDFLNTDYPKLLADEELPALEHTILLHGAANQLPGMDDFLAAGKHGYLADVQARIAQMNGATPSDIMYTSGTTGAPKGVISSHGQTVAIFEVWASTVGLNSDDRYLIANPFFHSFGYKAGWLSCLIKGATAIPMAVFNAEQMLKTIALNKISILPGAPTIFQSMLAESTLTNTDTSSLRCAVTGAANVPEQLVYDMKHSLGFDQVFTAYGLTECAVVSITRANDDLSVIANTAGKAINDTTVKILDDAGKEVVANETGKIMVQGFNVMQGYFNDPEATAETINAQGWLDTGDLGRKDDNGYIKVTDRAKDMFIAGGFNCYPAEIESLLLRHDNIMDVAVVGAPDKRLGEIGHAYLVLNANTGISHQSLTQWSREHMANFKVPRQFITVSELPRNASGKVQKFKLAELADKRVLT